MSRGIEIERQNYLTQSMTFSEMEFIQNQWKKLAERGLLECGKILTEIALQVFFTFIYIKF